MSATRPWSFSLRTLFGCFALAGVLLVVANDYGLRQKNQALRAENRRLRDEVGELSVEDPSQVHAVRAPSLREHEWVYRVWIPEGERYVARVVGRAIPAQNFPADGGSIRLEAGEQILRYRIVTGQDGKHWGSLATLTAAVGSYEQPWLDWPSIVATGSGIERSTVAFEPRQRVEVLRYRVSQADSTNKLEELSAGFLIWLEPLP